MSEKSLIKKALTDTVLTRRSFLKWSAALGGTAALAGGLNYGLKAVKAAAQPSEGKWVTVACWHNCGGRCLIKASVVDGVVTRVKSDDTHPDSPDFPQQRACVRGHSQRMQVFAADRLKYPMKRKNWAPGGGNKELRGKDEWVRISWDEALDIVASEIKNVKEKYGNEAILAPGGAPLLNAYGGAWETWGMVSIGAWPQPVTHMAGRSAVNTFFAEGGASDRMELRNSKLIVLWGANPAWSSQGNPTYNYLQAKKAGAKFICVDPLYSATSVGLADEWIPVRPSTDAALLLGMAYYMIENNLQDQDFLDKYTVGFDGDHMPEGANPQENFKDYVLGTYDGIPKTPEWASEICGTEPNLIRSFAQEIATTKPAALLSSFAPARTYIGEQFCQAFLTVGWMTGNVGIHGGMVAENGHATAGNQGNPLVSAGATGVTTPPNPISAGTMAAFFGAGIDQTTLGIVWDEAWNAVVSGEFTDGPRGKHKVDIHLIYLIGENSALNQHPNINRGIEAFRKVDFVVTSSHFLTTNAKYSDVVLPATTQWERDGALLSGNREILIYAQKAVEPLFEAKNDETANVSTTTGWVERELATRLGLDVDKLFPLSLKQQIYNQLAGAMVVKPDGSGYEPLLTITADDIAELGAEGQPQKGRITFQEFKEKGIYQVPRSPGDNLGFIAYKAFREDPEANPLPTPSGKLQIHSQALTDTIKSYGWTETTPIPTYRPPLQGYEATFSDWKNKVKGEFPLQIWTPHYMRRSHSVFDNVTWLREAFPQELFMNPVDAEQRGIKNDDTVLVISPHGKVLRHAKVTPRIVVGTIALGEGAWVERDDETQVDKAGATNSLSGTTPTGQGVQPWNTCIGQVEKWDGEPLEADYKWPQRIPLKEA
jgi:anaerobic dimethyl sulfoxide reductase subunit A